MKRNFSTLIICCVFAILFIEGCGYTTSSILSYGAKSIYIDNFKNKIKLTEEVSDERMYIGYKSGIELDITRETIDRFILDGNLKVTKQDLADLVLEGDLIDFRKEALRFDANDNIIEFRVKVMVDMELYDTRNNKIIFKEKEFTGESTYRTTGEFAKSEDTAIQEAVRDLATRIVERTTEGW